MDAMPKPYIPNDKWAHKAAAEGFRARSVYKLMELDERFRLLKQGQIVLDLGAAPGSWLQFASTQIGPKGKVIGVDLTPIAEVASNVKTFTQDMTDEKAIAQILSDEGITAVDLVLSDLAPNTSGVRDVDQWRSIELSQSVITIARQFLKPKGTCVIKVLRGADFDAFLRECKAGWHTVKPVTVAASRDRSREVYLVLSDHL